MPRRLQSVRINWLEAGEGGRRPVRDVTRKRVVGFAPSTSATSRIITVVVVAAAAVVVAAAAALVVVATAAVVVVPWSGIGSIFPTVITA